MQGIQKTIYDIIKTSRELGLPYITTHDIIEESKKTSLGSKATEFVIMNGKPDLEYNKLTAAVWQALQNLKNKDLIRNTSHGKWTVKAHSEKYKPSICKALILENKVSCTDENCSWFELEKENEPRKHKCPTCGKSTRIEFNRWHCPVKNCYIATPESQCELLHGFDTEKRVMSSTPMKPCYFAKTPSKPEIEHTIIKLKMLAEKAEREQAESMEHT